MKRKQKLMNNPIMDSVAEIKRLELNEEIKYAYNYAKKALGAEFEQHMKGIAEEILSLQMLCISGTSYYIAGILLTLPPDESEDINEENNDDFAFYVMMVKAAIGWGLLNGHGNKDNPFLDELRNH